MIRTSTKSPLADEGISRVAAVPTHRALQLVLFLFAAILIGRSIPQQSDWQWWFANYENWRGYMPFQGRCLMVPILHWAALSPMMIHLAVIFKQSCLGPDNLMLEFVDVLSILGTGAITIRLRKQFAPVSLFPWLAPFLVLWGVACTYAIRYESRFYMPYDLPALFFFSVGLLACVERRVLLFLAVLLVGTYNRETTIFLVPIWLCCNWREAKQDKLKLWAAPLLGALIWLLVKLHIRHLTHGAASGLGITLNWQSCCFPITGRRTPASPASSSGRSSSSFEARPRPAPQARLARLYSHRVHCAGLRLVERDQNLRRTHPSRRRHRGRRVRAIHSRYVPALAANHIASTHPQEALHG